jgi:4-aminobutyrate aminotransferase-like enzyme
MFKRRVPSISTRIGVSVLTRELCRKRKVLIGHGGIKGNVLRVQPPLVITEKEIDTLVSTIETSLKEVGK